VVFGSNLGRTNGNRDWDLPLFSLVALDEFWASTFLSDHFHSINIPLHMSHFQKRGFGDRILSVISVTSDVVEMSFSRFYVRLGWLFDGYVQPVQVLGGCLTYERVCMSTITNGCI